MIGADCVFLSYWLCWLVAIATAISGIKYLWDNRSFINTDKIRRRPGVKKKRAEKTARFFDIPTKNYR